MKTTLSLLLLFATLFIAGCGGPLPEEAPTPAAAPAPAPADEELGSTEENLHALPPNAVKLTSAMAAVYIRTDQAALLAESDLWAQAFEHFKPTRPLRVSPLKLTVRGHDVVAEAHFATF